MSIMPMMFPGHMLGSNLFGTANMQNVISPGTIPQSVSNASFNRIGPISAASISSSSPSTFPSISRPPSDFIPAAPFTYWPHQYSNIFGFPTSLGVPNLVSKNGLGVGPDLSNYLLNKAPFFRPPIPPFLPNQTQSQSLSCVPKTIASGAISPPRKRICDSDRQPAPSPYSISTASTSVSNSVVSSGEYCPICNQILPMSLSHDEVKCHLLEDIKETEERFTRLKRKVCGRACFASVGATALALDASVKSRLETFQRVKENRMTRMREKLANVHISGSNLSLSNGRTSTGRESVIHQSKDEENSGRRSSQRSMTSRSSRSSPYTPPSMVQTVSPNGADMMKTSTPESSTASSPTMATDLSNKSVCCL